MKHPVVFLCMFLFGNNFVSEAYDTPDLPKTTPEALPFHAVVHGKMVCNGILIAKNWVIAPAYCVHESKTVKVYLGFNGYPYFMSHHSEPNTQKLESAEICIHDDFVKVKDHYLNNIALIRLSTPAQLTEKVQLGKIIARHEAQLLEEKEAVISGWSVSVDDNMQFGPVLIRNQDTCEYIFGGHFLRSQELCIEWPTKARLNLLGNTMRVENKIVGFQTNSPKCASTTSSCTRNDMILNFMPFLDWMSRKMEIPVEEFTYPTPETGCICDLTEVKDLINKLDNEKVSSVKYDGDIAIINQKIENNVIEIQKIRTEQNNFAITLNEQINSLKNEITNTRILFEQNNSNLSEVLNGVRTEVSNGLSAQKSLADLEAQFKNLDANMGNKLEERLSKIDERIEDLENKTKNIEIIETVHYLEQKQEIEILNETLREIYDRELTHYHVLTDQIHHINITVQDISISQHTLDFQIGDITDQLKVHIYKEKEGLAELYEKIGKIEHIVAHNTLKQDQRCDEIEHVFGEMRHHVDEHSVKEFEEIGHLWHEVKSLNETVKQIKNHLYDLPSPN